MAHRRRRVAGLLVGVGLLAAGCTQTAGPSINPTSSPSVSAPPTATPAPTPTWDVHQSAAIAALEGYWAVADRIGADPAAYTKDQMTDLFSQYLGGNMIDANVNGYLKLQQNGWVMQGAMVAKSIRATEMVDNVNERGLEVHLTVCQDHTTYKIVDQQGEVVAAEQAKIQAFQLQQYAVRKPANSDRWLLFGSEPTTGPCGP